MRGAERTFRIGVPQAQTPWRGEYYNNTTLTGAPTLVRNDAQINFNKEWETKVVDRILHNVSILFGRTFNSVQDLNRYRKEVTKNLGERLSETLAVPVPRVA